MKPKVLLVEDDPIQSQLIRAMLRHRYQIIPIGPGDAVPDDFDAVVCDWQIPPLWVAMRDNLLRLAKRLGRPCCIHTAFRPAEAEFQDVAFIPKDGLIDNLDAWLKSNIQKSSKRSGLSQLLAWLVAAMSFRV